MAGSRNKIFFASDFHLGSHLDRGNHDREKKVVRWLDSIAADCSELYLLGDVFDFWFEYRQVVPKGFTRLLGTLARMSDSGISINLFTGNHDVWMFDYFPKEIGAKVFDRPQIIEKHGKLLMIGHGDGLGPGDRGYKLLKRVFTNRLAQQMFSLVPPAIGVSLARYFSRKSRESTGHADDAYLGDDKEFLVQYCHQVLAEKPIDYFIFGHRHLFIDKKLSDQARYINLGEWFNGCHYAVLDESGLTAYQYKKSGDFQN
ncbi:MAG: UDP-2,3-diacylglucosamine diphosphatase [Salibacteraceae bacterium]